MVFKKFSSFIRHVNDLVFFIDHYGWRRILFQKPLMKFPKSDSFLRPCFSFFQLLDIRVMGHSEIWNRLRYWIMSGSDLPGLKYASILIVGGIKITSAVGRLDRKSTRL